jgi:hypothetical protein
MVLAQNIVEVFFAILLEQFPDFIAIFLFATTVYNYFELLTHFIKKIKKSLSVFHKKLGSKLLTLRDPTVSCISILSSKYSILARSVFKRIRSIPTRMVNFSRGEQSLTFRQFGEGSLVLLL